MNIFAIFLSTIFILLIPYVKCDINLRVMTFNIWKDGAKVENGVEKIAKHIKANNPDIIAIQELKHPETLNNITKLLGFEWSAIYNTINKPFPDNAIITRHQFLDSTIGQTNRSIGVDIRLNSGHVVNFWGLHLYHLSYGPYAANNKMVRSKEQLMKGETMDAINVTETEWVGSRVECMEALLANEAFQKSLKNSDKVPVFVAGDFNSPSHLDWIESTKEKHGDWAFEWPVTKMLTDQANMTDSFRQVFPDPAKDPGETWSCIQKHSGAEWSYSIPEPQDRIDFIFYRSNRLVPIHSFIYAGNQPLEEIPNHYNNDYPSDHYAVITDFNLLSQEFKI